ncbi:DUF1700 domain-containing protein [Bacillus sp. FSL L8-0199]|uniref:DUF1700 domain-containing protein n=1 Tax=Bacillus thuringiensis TaxID=1428 RepID=A0AAW4HTJ9_BACTU|nr:MULTISPECIES: DUF1700 domain-containing protein [Bacillus cereus group]QQP78151.1 DUF1700 domain-containing protein [Bacillus sp. TK-2]EKS7854833.1 DUF1700 domain-containing protein [Bacillus cereus]EOP94714.1 hypothetical protein IIY_00436 [Bacillus cereus VD140]MBD8075135.1 DUF1700 domain-containing protein [Bacillus thuringiensis]MBN9899280.1 DUF1700 domain-containing protein [Bacillus thuringiensis]
MSKEGFLKELSSYLRKLPEEERQDILLDYEEHFQFGLEEGKTESEIIKGLGSPKVIAKELLAMYRFDEMKKNPSTSNVTRAVMAAIGLSLFNFIIVLGPLVAIIAFIFSFWIGGIASVVTPFFVIGKVFMGTFIWLDLFVSITFVGVGLLLCIIAFYSTKWFKRLCVRYVIWNFKMIKGE